ncbi:MAG: cytosine deaminase [Sneathiellaceae bacterium]
MTLSLILRNATLPDGRTGVDIGVDGARIAEVRPALDATAAVEIDAAGRLVTPPFVDPHFHLDATLSLGLNGRFNESGTLAEGIGLWREMQPMIDADGLYRRAMRYCDIAVAQGMLAIRSHVDVTDDRLLAAEVMAQVRKDVAPYLDLQLIAFPQMGFFCRPTMADSVAAVLDMGFEVVGGAPHLEQTAELGRRSVTALCEIAADRGAMVDMHCDENDDPLSRFIQDLTYESQRLGLQGMVTASHLTSMHSMDNFFAGRLIPQMAAAGMHVIANPLANMMLQGRFDSYPKRRGMTRVAELKAAGCLVAFGQDSTLDPWYPLGTADMLDVAWMAAHVGHLSGREALRSCFASVTGTAATIMRLDGYGLAPGCHADMVVLQADDPIEAIRLRAPRLHVIRRGRQIASTAPAVSRLQFDGRSATLDRSRA